MRRRRFLLSTTVVGIAALAGMRPSPAFALMHPEGCEDPPAPGQGGGTEQHGMSDGMKLGLWTTGASSAFIGYMYQYVAAGTGILSVVAVATPPGDEVVLAIASMVGFSVGGVLVEAGSNVMGLANDPPDPFYARPVTLTGLDVEDLTLLAYAGQDQLDWLDHLTQDQRALVQKGADFLDASRAFLDALELRQGAEDAGDAHWVLEHEAELVQFSQQLAWSVEVLLEMADWMVPETMSFGDDLYQDAEYVPAFALSDDPVFASFQAAIRLWCAPSLAVQTLGDEKLAAVEADLASLTWAEVKELLEEAHHVLQTQVPRLGNIATWLNNFGTGFGVGGNCLTGAINQANGVGGKGSVVAAGEAGKGGSGVGPSPTKMTGLALAEFRSGADLSEVEVQAGDVLIVTSLADQNMDGLTALTGGGPPQYGLVVVDPGTKDSVLLVDASELLDEGWDDVNDATWLLYRPKDNGNGNTGGNGNGNGPP